MPHRTYVCVSNLLSIRCLRGLWVWARNATSVWQEKLDSLGISPVPGATQ